MSANTSDSSKAEVAIPSTAKVPKKITNAQTVCNERSEKGKLCNGHLKQLNTGGEDARVHLRGDDVLFKCNICGTLYMGPPLGHLRDPGKMNRFVERELTALLQAAGGTLPAFAKNASGALVQVSPAPEGHGHAAPAAKAAAAPAPAEETAEQKRARKLAEAAARKATVAPIPGASGPVAGETPEQKIARLKAVAAEAKRRKEAGETGAPVEATGATSQAQAPAPATPTAKAPPAARKAAPIPGASGPVPGETPEQKIARLKAVAAEAKRRKEAGETGETAAEASQQAAPVATAPAPEVKAAPAAPKPKPAAPSGPVPGETKEQKMARLQAVVAEAKRRKEAGEEPAPSVKTEPVAAAPAEVAPPPQVEASTPPPAPVAAKPATPQGPVPGETKEEKIARLKAQVEAAKLKAGK